MPNGKGWHVAFQTEKNAAFKRSDSKTLTPSQYDDVDLTSHWQVFQNVHHLSMTQRLNILPVDLLDDITFLQATTPLGIKDHLNFLAKRAVSNGKSKSSGPFH